MMGWFWLLLLLILVPLYMNRNSLEGQKGRPETPLEILQKRYARGEISREQFEEIKKNLT